MKDLLFTSDKRIKIKEPPQISETLIIAAMCKLYSFSGMGASQFGISADASPLIRYVSNHSSIL